MSTENRSDEPRDKDAPPRAGGGGRGPGGPGGRRFLYRRRKVCKFCAEKIDRIDWKDSKLLLPYIPERGKVLPRRISGTCSLHQRKLMTAIKRARNMALIAFATE